MRILHTSDWHLGRQFHNVSLIDDQRHILDEIISIIRQREVELVIVAGDVYDRSVPPAPAIELLDATVQTICGELGVAMILMAGNHDGPQRLGFAARQLSGSGLHLVGPLWQEPAPILFEDEHGALACYPIPYADPATVRQQHGIEASGHDAAMAHLLERVHEDNGTERRAVVIAHCFLAGGETSESERPLSLGGAEAVQAEHFLPFSYAALGHLHGAQFRGAEHIRYAGSPLKYSFSEEKQKKSVTLVEIDGAGKAQIEKIPLTPLRDMRSLEGELETLLQQGKSDPQRDDYLLVRLTDSHAILDVMNKLREVYPNVLHLERPGLMGRGEALEVSRERLKKGEMSLFADFYAQVSGAPLSDEQQSIIAGIIETLHKEVE
ncbi:MAG: exonuclease sbcCD subunit D [Desulfuromonas sp.]|nr:MAG: exonuclease sbcCD subunit D [Desulfuromonas sp.]